MIQLLAEYICEKIYKIVILKQFTEFGALCFENQVRVLLNGLNNMIIDEGTIRNTFNKLNSVVHVLCVRTSNDVSLIDESCGLSKEEIRTILKLRIDL